MKINDGHVSRSYLSCVDIKMFSFNCAQWLETKSCDLKEFISRYFISSHKLKYVLRILFFGNFCILISTKRTI